jgi:light-regulated signal transduction histidine kinase (bacteriophytochrome)
MPSPFPKKSYNIYAIYLPINDNVSLIKQQKEKIDRINVDLQNQLEIIESQKVEIEQSNNNLEHKVFERTKQLEHQNKQLAEYAFINAHLLRAPVCTIMGLVNLMKYSDLSSEDIVIISKLSRSVKTLDEIVKKINIAIRERRHFDRNALEDGREGTGITSFSN